MLVVACSGEGESEARALSITSPILCCQTTAPTKRRHALLMMKQRCCHADDDSHFISQIINNEAQKNRRQSSQTFIKLHVDEIHLFHAFFQLVLGRRSHRVDVFILAVVLLHRVRREHLQTRQQGQSQRANCCFTTLWFSTSTESKDWVGLSKV